MKGSKATRGAFADLFDSHAEAIFKYGFHRVADWARAEDIVSMTFLIAWRNRDRLPSEPEAQLSWLYGIATNVIRNEARSRRRHRAALARVPEPDVEPDIAERALEQTADEDMMRTLAELLHQLPLVEQEAFVLCAWEGLRPSQVAAVLDIPEVTVRTRLHRARERLRGWIRIGERGADIVGAPAAIKNEGSVQWK